MRGKKSPHKAGISGVRMIALGGTGLDSVVVQKVIQNNESELR